MRFPPLYRFQPFHHYNFYLLCLNFEKLIKRSKVWRKSLRNLLSCVFLKDVNSLVEWIGRLVVHPHPGQQGNLNKEDISRDVLPTVFLRLTSISSVHNQYLTRNLTANPREWWSWWESQRCHSSWGEFERGRSSRLPMPEYIHHLLSPARTLWPTEDISNITVIIIDHNPLD